MSRHKKISFAKSAIRIIGYVAVGFAGGFAVVLGMSILVVSEVLGIVEEVGEK